MRSRIVEWGYNISADDTFEETSYRFFNIWNRRIDPRPRRVHEAMGFECPHAHAAGYNQLLRAFLDGQDVNCYLSKSLLKPDYSDDLLNDWRIHHFHLGQQTDETGFVSRTGPLLFAMMFHSDVLCIAILPHGNWSKKELLKILHHNWPAVLEPYRIKGISGLRHDYSDEEIALLRKNQINAFIQVEPGFVYGMLGGGYSAAGASGRAEIQSINFKERIISLEIFIRENAGALAHHIQSQGFNISGQLEFRLHVDSVGLHAVEVNSRTTFLLLRLDDLDSEPTT